MGSDYYTDRSFSDKYIAQAFGILSLLPAGLFVDFEEASFESDIKEATDVIAVANGRYRIPMRFRRPHKTYRDLTIRSSRPTGIKTELQKIKEGFGDYYFYGWTEGDTIIEWMLVDLDKLRASGLLEKSRREIPSPDRTYFIAIDRNELEEHGCIIASKF
ncbi:MAG: hypothetical protein ACYC56_10340 [Candidatus Aquicultor sp.]